MAIHSDYDYGIINTKADIPQNKNEPPVDKAYNSFKSNILSRLYAWFRKK